MEWAPSASTLRASSAGPAHRQPNSKTKYTLAISTSSPKIRARLLAWPVTRYITRNHRRLFPTAIPNPAKIRLAPYSPAEILNEVRILERDPLPIPQIRLAYADLALTAAITFGDLIVTRAPMSPALLFHELVHVVQYRQLGVPAFARNYVQGLLTHRAYERFPLEVHAFRVETEVARLLNA